MHKINKKYPITIGLLLAVAALALIFLPKQTQATCWTKCS